MTIKQKVVTVEYESDGDGVKRISVRRMAWRPAREFFKRYAELLAGVYASASASGNGSDESTILRGLLGNMAELVSKSDELVMLLCTASTGLTAEEIDKLDSLVALGVLNAALAVNCDDETKNSFAGIGAKLAALVSAPTKTN